MTKLRVNVSSARVVRVVIAAAFLFTLLVPPLVLSQESDQLLVLEGVTSHVDLPPPGLPRGGPESLPYDGELRFSGRVAYVHPMFGIDPSVQLTWRTNGVIFFSEIRNGSHVIRYFSPGTFTITDEASPAVVPVLTGRFIGEIGLLQTWNEALHWGIVQGGIEFTGGSAPYVPPVGPWPILFGGGQYFVRDTAGWFTTFHGDINVPVIRKRGDFLRGAPSSWGQIKSLYR